MFGPLTKQNCAFGPLIPTTKMVQVGATISSPDLKTKTLTKPAMIPLLVVLRCLVEEQCFPKLVTFSGLLLVILKTWVGPLYILMLSFVFYTNVLDRIYHKEIKKLPLPN